MCLGNDAATEKDARLRSEQASAPAIASWGFGKPTNGSIAAQGLKGARRHDRWRRMEPPGDHRLGVEWYSQAYLVPSRPSATDAVQDC
jgi:hypothetical protein